MPVIAFPDIKPFELGRLRSGVGHLLRVTVTLCGVILVSGLSLDIAQLFAWGVMLRDNLESQSVSESILTTFEKEARCNLCLAIEQARQDDQEQHALTWVAKPPLLPITMQRIGWLMDMQPFSYASWIPVHIGSIPHRPLLPPPRRG